MEGNVRKYARMREMSAERGLTALCVGIVVACWLNCGLRKLYGKGKVCPHCILTTRTS